MRITSCLFALTVFVSIAAGASPTTRPNIVIILADDMGYSDIGCFGSEISTPNIDRLASEGVKFTSFYNTARCCPTRAALLTGLYSHQAGMGWMTSKSSPTLPGYKADLSHDAVTIAEVLRAGGYATYMVGKWHITNRDGPKAPKDNWPMQRGFQRYYGTVRGGGSYYDPAMLTRDNTPISPVADSEYQPADGQKYYYTDALADQASRFVREHGKSEEQQKLAASPFFMYVAFTSPHWPMNAPEETIAKYKGKYDAGYEPIRAARFAKQKQLGLIDDKWELSPQAGEWDKISYKPWEARCMEVYAAMVDRMDQGIGRIVESLRETGQLDNTLIFFLSDNGGCAEVMGREKTTPKIPPLELKPTDVQPDVRPRLTRDGKPVLDGKDVMPGPEGTYIAYGKNWANVSDTPFREYKHWVHEGGISTPLIVRWPAGCSRHGEIERQAGHVIDLMATCVDVAGASYPKEFAGHKIIPMQGVSLAPALRGESLHRQRPIFWEHEGNRAVRDGKWKLVAKGEKGAWELYDMEADRSEMHDLAEKEPERVKAMGEAWQKWAEASQVLPMNPFPAGPASRPAE